MVRPRAGRRPSTEKGEAAGEAGWVGAHPVETMEKRGLVGPANGAEDREVLIDPM